MSEALCSLYAFGVPNSVDVVKVGISTDPAKRLNTIQHNSGNGLIEILAQYPFINKSHARCAEAFCHASLKSFHTHGEFFRHPSGVDGIVQVIEDTLADGGFARVDGSWAKSDGHLKTSHLERPMCKGIRELLNNPEVIARRSEGIRKAWATPEFRARMGKIFDDPEARKRSSDRLQAAWVDPERSRQMREHLNSPDVKARAREGMRKSWTDPEVRKRRLDGMRASASSPKARARMSEQSRKFMADPANKARLSEQIRKALADPEVKRRKSEATRQSWASGRKRASFRRAKSSPNQMELF